MAVSSPLLEVSIDGAKGGIVYIVGPTDMGLEEVEIATNMVKEMADPNALFMFGAAFDDTLEDEIRVTVIATGFGDVANPLPGGQEEKKPEDKPAAPARKDDDFTVKPPMPISEEPETPEDDPYDEIFRIFNKGK